MPLPRFLESSAPTQRYGAVAREAEVPEGEHGVTDDEDYLVVSGMRSGAAAMAGEMFELS
jgi:hypothetical protein